MAATQSLCCLQAAKEGFIDSSVLVEGTYCTTRTSETEDGLSNFTCEIKVCHSAFTVNTLKEQ
jgi:hypothetical protein